MRVVDKGFYMFSIRLSKDLESRLDALATRTNRAKAFYVKKALSKFLEEQEEIEWATAAYQEFLESGKKTVSFEEVMRENGLLDESN